MMSEETFIIGGHGLGDCILSLQCASFVENPKILISTRDSVFKPLQFLFRDKFDISQIDPDFSENNNILSNSALINKLGLTDKEFYYVIPDLLFRNPYRFDYEKYNTNPQLIKSTRLLEKRKAKIEKIIYLGLQTSTQGYLYNSIPELIKALAHSLPDHTIYFPQLKEWAGKNLQQFNFDNFLDKNILIHEDPSFIESLKILESSCFFVGTDNGPSHAAYQLGIPRLLLDPHFGRPHVYARWRENNEDSVPINIQASQASEIITNCVRHPELNLISKDKIYQNLAFDFARVLMHKY